MRNSPRFSALVRAAITTEAEIASRCGRQVSTPVTAPVAGAAGQTADTDIFPDRYIDLCWSERDVARLLANHASGRLAWIREEDAWLLWRQAGAGGAWRGMASDTVQSIVSSTAQANMGTRSADGDQRMRPATGGRASTAVGVMRLLAGMIGSSVSEWDAKSHLVGIPFDRVLGDGVLNIRTGAIRPTAASDRIRWSLSTVPATRPAYESSKFRMVIEHAVPYNAEREWLCRRFGAALMDAVGYDDLIWLYGPANSGKGLVVVALRAVFGDYAASVPPAEILRGGHRGHPEWRARLAGRRLMIADDLAPRDIDESVVKSLLGSEQVAHHMRQPSFDFTLAAPLLVTANHPPTIRSMDPGLRRRLRPIHGGATIMQQDPTLRELMGSSAERSACLRWLLDGAESFLAEGAPPPPSILSAADEAMTDTPIAIFAEQWVTDEPTAWTSREQVYSAYVAHMQALGGRPDGNRTVVRDLHEIGWQDKKRHGIRGWCVRAVADTLESAPASTESDTEIF